ncbi:putative 2OG-Fe(II) oxygenase [Alteromonas sp. A079]|uniref:putative 2OG-Fe(II) oxygenase n=1 Tax=Alteromonas sp. A079 TaxID=3410268 RepID=UPI003BA1BFDE
MSVNPSIIIPQLIQAYRAKRYDYVVSTLSNNVALQKVDAVIPQVYGGALRKLGDLKKAKSVFEKGIKRFPGHPDLLNSLANLMVELNEPRHAVTYFNKALAIRPKYFDYEYNLARALVAAKRYNDAKILFVSLLQTSPSHLNTRVAYAGLCAELNDIEGATHQLLHVLDYQPSHVIALNNLGNIKRTTGEFEEAISLYQRALGAGATAPDIYQNLAACLVLNSASIEAIEVYKQGVAAFPLHRGLHHDLAHYLWTQNDNDPFRFLRDRLDVTSPDLVLLYCDLLINVDEFDDAEPWLKTLLNTEQRDIVKVAAPYYSRVLRERGEYEQALVICSKYSQITKKEPLPLLIEQGYALLSLNRVAQAKQCFLTCCKIAPHNQGFWTLYSTALRLEGDLPNYAELCNYDAFVYADALYADKDVNAAFNRQLQQYLLTLHNNEQHPIGQSLRHGSQTFEDLFDDPAPVIQTMKERIIENVSTFVASQIDMKKHPFLSRLSTQFAFKGSWSVKLRKTGFHKSHYHSAGWLSGVYYVDVPDEVEKGGNGWLVFGRPDLGNISLCEDYAIKPVAGNLVLFPSYLWHGTNPINSAQHRMTVAFDIVPQ